LLGTIATPFVLPAGQPRPCEGAILREPARLGNWQGIKEERRIYGYPATSAGAFFAAPSSVGTGRASVSLPGSLKRQRKE